MVSFNDIPVDNLDELIQLIPTLVQKQYFTIEYKNAASFISFGGKDIDLHMGRDRYKANVAYNAHTEAPKLWVFDATQMEWKSTYIYLSTSL